MMYSAWIIFAAAALLEVGGDAIVRKGLRGHHPLWIVVGMLTLGCYGLLVNVVRWDFSKLLGVYVAVFAVVSILFGQIVFHEKISTATWIGLLLIVVGGLTIQFGPA